MGVQLIEYNVSEDAIPLDPSSSSAGYGQLTYTRLGYDDGEDSIDLEKPYTLTDLKRGTFQGIVRDISTTDQVTQVSADSILAYLSAWYTVPPYTGTLVNYLKLLLDIVGKPASVQATVTAANPNIRVPGFEGNVWDKLKQLLSVLQIDVAQVKEVIQLRPFRHFTTEQTKIVSETETINSQSAAEWVQVYYYDPIPPLSMTQDLEMFPLDTVEFSPISVGAGETLVQQVTVSGSVSQVNQPVAMDYVAYGQNFDGTNGGYCVSGNDGKPILASRWKAGGGDVRVRLTTDPSIIEIVVTGSKIEEYAPYRIAATAGSSSFYNSLHVTGRGMRWYRKSITVHSGAPHSGTDNETPTEIDNKFITTPAGALQAAMYASMTYGGGVPTLQGSTDRVQVLSAPGAVVGQVFGQVVGARAKRGNAMFRVQSVTTDPSVVQYDLSMDTTFGDFNTAQPANLTVAQFNSLFGVGTRFLDFNNKPLFRGA